MTGSDDPVLWVIVANAVIWLGMGGYAAFVARRQMLLAKLIKQLEILSDADQA